jgi:hypothetical protein
LDFSAVATRSSIAALVATLVEGPVLGAKAAAELKRRERIASFILVFFSIVRGEMRNRKYQ